MIWAVLLRKFLNERAVRTNRIWDNCTKAQRTKSARTHCATIGVLLSSAAQMGNAPGNTCSLQKDKFAR